jgi:DNA-binding transcriptional MerR regulator
MTFSIAEVAASTGLSMDTLRYYERIGLLEPPARDSGGRRSYSEQDVTWLDFLTKLRLTGMPIKKMQEYSRLRHVGVGSASRRKQLLVEQRALVLARMAELQQSLNVLDYKISSYAEIELKFQQILNVDDREDMTA